MTSSAQKTGFFSLCLHTHWARTHRHRRCCINESEVNIIANWTIGKGSLSLVILNHEWQNSYTDSVFQICSTSCSLVQRLATELYWLWRVHRAASSPKQQRSLRVNLWFNWVFWMPKKSCGSYEKTAEVSFYDALPKVQASRSKTLETVVSASQVNYGYCPGKQANLAKKTVKEISYVTYFVCISRIRLSIFLYTFSCFKVWNTTAVKTSILKFYTMHVDNNR